MTDNPPETQAKETVFHKLQAWGESSVPPTILATLVAAQHLKPFQWPALFSIPFLGCSYANINGFTEDAALWSAALSGTYMLNAMRRRPAHFVQRFNLRGIVRGATLGLCAVQLAGGVLAYVFRRRDGEEGDG